MSSQPLLEVNGLVTVFSSGDAEINAVNNISFTLHKGETVGIVGESGSGKSVTSLSIMKLIPNPPGRIKAGSISLTSASGSKIDIVNAGEEQVRTLRGNRIAMIFQEPMTSLNPVMRCGDQVTEALLLHRKMNKANAKQKVLDLFAEVQLPDPAAMFACYPHQLSGGQKQRVMIAMAMSCEPEVLIADEPTTALDVTVQKTILNLMLELQKRHGLGIIFITHDLGVVAEIADSVIVMYKGNIVEKGPVLDIFSRPEHPYTRSLLACRPPLDTKPRRLPVVSDFMEVLADGSFVEKVFSPYTHKLEQQVAPAERDLILSVKQLNTWFPGRKNFFGKTLSYTKAVDNVSFDVFAGETLGLVGESGCGKSTLGRTLIRLVPANSGQVIYKGRDLLRLSEKDFRFYRRKMQIIFQDPYSSLNPRITIGEAICEPMRIHGLYASEHERKEQVIDLLQKVGLSGAQYGRYPHEFSGGQRQRVCIARALAVKPEFIICDESVSALDVSVQAQVLNLLNDLKQEFMFTCIFISHDLGVVKYMSDRMIVMRKGQIVEMGVPEKIYSKPESDYTRNLINSIPDGSIEHIRRVHAAKNAGKN